MAQSYPPSSVGFILFVYGFARNSKGNPTHQQNGNAMNFNSYSQTIQFIKPVEIPTWQALHLAHDKGLHFFLMEKGSTNYYATSTINVLTPVG